MSYKKSLPKYYEVNFDVFVRVYLEDDRIVGINHLGNPYDPFQAVREGRLITKAEFDRHAKKL